MSATTATRTTAHRRPLRPAPEASALTSARGLRRVARYFTALLLAIASYWSYSLVVVPVIEPAAPPPAPLAPRAAATTQLSQLDLTRHFPPGAWQLDAKVLETKDGVLVFGDESKTGDRLTLKPMTLILLNESDSKSQARPRPVILEAPEGAELLTVESGGAAQYFGKPVSGRLKGEITIRRAAGEDDNHSLRITTRDVNVESGRIWTRHEVRFAFGSHWGVGQELEIQLNDKDDSQPAPEPNPNRPANPIRSLRLATLNKLMAYVESKSTATQPPGVDAARGIGPSAAAPQPAHSVQLTPVEITCQGPFELDVDQQVATLQDRVVVKLSPRGADTAIVTCDRIELHFDEQPAPGVAATPAATQSLPTDETSGSPMGSYRLTRLTAIGTPVRMVAAATRSEAVAEELNYDFANRRISLSGKQPVALRHEGNAVTAIRIDYEMPPEGIKQLGRLWAAGPGRIDAMLGTPPKPIVASWKRLLRVQPQDGKQVISLFENVVLDFRGDAAATGAAPPAATLQALRFQSETLHLYVFQAPGLRPGPGEAAAPVRKATYFPDSLLATGDVRIDSPILTARTHEVQMWFRPLVTAPAAATPSVEPPSAAPPGAPNSPPPTAPPAPKPTQRHTAVGQLVQARLRYDPQFQVTLDDIQVQGNVDFRSEGPQGAMRITGQSMHLRGGDPGAAVAHLHGTPARLEARGSWIAANSLMIDQAANRIAADGGGTLGLMAPGPQGGKTQVTWAGPMVFDGVTARFQQQARIQGEAMDKSGSLHRFEGAADDLNLSLTQPLRLAELEKFGEFSKNAVQLRALDLTGKVNFMGSSFQRGAQLSHERVEAHHMHYDHTTGKLTAQGPGWLSTVRPQQSESDGAGNVFQGVAAPPAPRGNPGGGGPPDKNELNYIRVTFQDRVEGNTLHQDLQLRDNVRVVYGPVKRFEDVIPDEDYRRPGSRSIEVHCAELRAARLKRNRQQGLTLNASGSTRIFAAQFDAQAERLSFDQLKDLVVLEGNPRTGVVLRYSPTAGAEPITMSAERIRFSPTTMDIQTDGFRGAQGRPSR